MEQLTDELFVKEMQIFWQGISQSRRITVGRFIRDHFNAGDRAEKVISKMQITQ